MGGAPSPSTRPMDVRPISTRLMATTMPITIPTTMLPMLLSLCLPVMPARGDVGVMMSPLTLAQLLLLVRGIDKVVMVEETEYDDVIECKHSYSQKCHTTYTADFEPQQEEECEENFIKSCFIEYKKVASDEQIQFCNTPLIGDGEGPEECRTA